MVDCNKNNNSGLPANKNGQKSCSSYKLNKSELTNEN